MPYILSDKISDFNGSNDEKARGASGWPLHPSAPEEELQLQAPQGAQPCGATSDRFKVDFSMETIRDMADAHGEKTRIIWFLKTTDFCWVWVWMFEVPDFQSGHFHFVNCLGGITAWWSSLHGFHLFGDRVLESTNATQAVNKDLPQLHVTLKNPKTNSDLRCSLFSSWSPGIWPSKKNYLRGNGIINHMFLW